MRRRFPFGSLALHTALGGALWLMASLVAADPAQAPEGTATAPTQGAAEPAEAPEDATHAVITFSTIPNVTAVVFWGRKILGQIKPGKPLVIERPRDSGPLDVIIRAKGYLAVQTRAHTFSDTRLAVKLTPIDNKSELLGYKAPIEEPVIDEAVEAAQSAAATSDASSAPDPTPPHP